MAFPWVLNVIKSLITSRTRRRGVSDSICSNRHHYIWYLFHRPHILSTPWSYIEEDPGCWLPETRWSLNSIKRANIGEFRLYWLKQHSISVYLGVDNIRAAAVATFIRYTITSTCHMNPKPLGDIIIIIMETGLARFGVLLNGISLFFCKVYIYLSSRKELGLLHCNNATWGRSVVQSYFSMYFESLWYLNLTLLKDFHETPVLTPMKQVFL